jgi:ribosomal protein S9
VNWKSIDDHAPPRNGRMVARQALEITSNASAFDIMVQLKTGWRQSGQAGADGLTGTTGALIRR